MKKIIISTILLLMISFPVFAYVEPGYGINLTCTTSNYYKSNCKDEQDIFKRIAELEKRVNDLETECQSSLEINKIYNLDIRLQEVENTIKTLQEGIFNSLKGILLVLIQK